MATTITSTTTTKYTHLFTPLNLGSDVGILPNRVTMGSMHTGLEHYSLSSLLVPFLMPSDKEGDKKKRNENEGEVTEDDEPLDRMARYLQTRGVGLMVTGGNPPNYQGWTSPFSSQLTKEAEMRHHKVVMKAVHAAHVPIVVVPPPQLHIPPLRMQRVKCLFYSSSSNNSSSYYYYTIHNN
jgi:2,4-dienoyl-CoA reductase (NADPH2)